MQSRDPSRVTYNGLVPFAVSMVEYFFSQLFQILIKYDKAAIKKKMEHNLRINGEVLLEVMEGQKTAESLIAEEYTFQNMNHLNKAFKDWLGIDIRKIPSQIGTKHLDKIEKSLLEIILFIEKKYNIKVEK